MTGVAAVERPESATWELAGGELAAPAPRGKWQARHFFLKTKAQLEQLFSFLTTVPLDARDPLEVVIREPIKQRGLDANARMWAGPLKDIETQGWVDDGTGKARRYRDIVWHDYFKRAFLPEEFTEGMTKDGYVKWATAPDGERVLVGSTTQLTKQGFAEYLGEIEAYGVRELGVKFSISPHEIPFMNGRN